MYFSGMTYINNPSFGYDTEGVLVAPTLRNTAAWGGCRRICFRPNFQLMAQAGMET